MIILCGHEDGIFPDNHAKLKSLLITNLGQLVTLGRHAFLLNVDIRRKFLVSFRV